MKKIFKFITIAVVFLLSLVMFGKAKTFLGKGQKGHMAKLV